MANKIAYESLIPALSAITSSYEKNIGTSNQENTTLVLVANLMEKLSQLAFQTANLSVQEKRASLTKEELLEQLKSKEAQLSNQKDLLNKYLNELPVFKDAPVNP